MRPIIFSGPMVRAILAGRKTQTRRIVRPQPAPNTPHDGGTHWVHDLRNDGLHVPVGTVGHLSVAQKMGLRCPYGQPGDRLWVRETWMPLFEGVHYRAASRLTLEILQVRIERLHNLSDADARAEGIDWSSPQFSTEREEDPREVGYGPADGSFALDNFRRGWDEINGKRATWASNPWVWAITFRRVL